VQTDARRLDFYCYVAHCVLSTFSRKSWLETQHKYISCFAFVRHVPKSSFKLSNVDDGSGWV